MSRRTTTNNGTANLRAAGLPEIEATAAATVAASDIGKRATQKGKPIITDVQQSGGMYQITYSTGTVKKVIASKLPGTARKWLEAHAAEVEATEEPETTMETAAADPEQGTETTMEMEPVKVEASAEAEPEALDIETEPVRTTEATPEQPKAAEPVKASTTTTEPVRKPHNEPLTGIWFNPLQLALLIGIRAAQATVFMIWATVQMILALMTAAATIRQAVPVIISRVRAGYMALTAQATTAAQTLREATGAARMYWTEVYMDMRRDVPQVVRVSNKTLLRFGQTILSTIR